VFPLNTTPKRLLTELLELVTGVPHSGTQAQLEPLLIEALSDKRRLISVDEAQHLNYPCVEYLRHLHDHPETNFGLVLVGGNGCWELLNRYPMLRSRIFQRVKFRPLEPDRVVELLPRLHPIYEDADPELVRMVDDVLAHGNLRNWVSFTRSALGLLQEHGLDRLTEVVARNVFALNGGAAVTAGGGAASSSEDAT
jgi:DNA transposition AAA+ family ATPase